MSEARKYSPIDDLQDLRAVFSEHVDLSGPERSVLAVLILRRNGKTGQMDPSVNRIAEEAGVDRRTVLRALSSLDGEWLQCERAIGRRTRYSLTVPHQCHRVTGVTESPGWCHRVTTTGVRESPERTK